MSENLRANQERIANSPSYRLAESDLDFLTRPELRPLRLQLELQKPEMAFVAHGIESTIVVFGGTQVVEVEEAPDHRRLGEAVVAPEMALQKVHGAFVDEENEAHPVLEAFQLGADVPDLERG